MRAKIIVAAALLLGLVAWDFAAAHLRGRRLLFLAFARLEPNPLLAFTRDMHGGEYYRPLPMLLWGCSIGWGRAPSGRSPWRVFCCTREALLWSWHWAAVGSTLRVSLAAGALFLIAPAEREAALWFAASTDLLATIATLAALVCLLRASRRLASASVALAALAYFSKETGWCCAAWNSGEVGGFISAAGAAEEHREERGVHRVASGMRRAGGSAYGCGGRVLDGSVQGCWGAGRRQRSGCALVGTSLQMAAVWFMR